MTAEYEGNYTIRRAWRRLIWVSGGAVMLLAFVIWEGPTSGSPQEDMREVTGAAGRLADMPGGFGTSGGDAVRVSEPGVANPGIHELETITGALDGHELVGQQVDLHVDLASDPMPMDAGVRFWIGPTDNRVLVILSNGIASLDGGRRYAIAGTIQRLPAAQAMSTWELTKEERQNVAQRPIYVAATRVIPE